MFIKRILWAGWVAAALLMAGCSSTSVSGSWKNPDFSGRVGKIYIIGIAKQETARRLFEDQFSSELTAYGVTGVSSYRELPMSEETDKEMIAARVKANDADSVLLARVTGQRTEEVVNPGQRVAYDYGPHFYGRRGYYPDPYYRDYGGYYNRSRQIVYQPVATVTQYQIATIEANLYKANSSELLWSAQLETEMGGNLEKVITDFVKAVTKDLDSKGLI